MAEIPYKPLVYALQASSPFVTQAQPPQPGSEAVFYEIKFRQKIEESVMRSYCGPRVWNLVRTLYNLV